MPYGLQVAVPSDRDKPCVVHEAVSDPRPNEPDGLDGPGPWVDPGGAVEEAERIRAQVEPDQSEQLRQMRVWRLDHFTGLGFDSARATLMADDTQVDLAQARRLIALGCPLETAARILL
jgi:hypothetical protein